MIKYRYAYDKNREIVHISNLSKKSKKPEDKYICISCGKELIPKIGEVRKKHFAHKEVVSCSAETYLHILGKKIFIQEYTKCKKENIPFFIELNKNEVCDKCSKDIINFNFPCNLGKKIEKYNLLSYFPLVELEKKENEFIPDILLASLDRKNKVFLEIAVTHSSSNDKLKSGYRVIELCIFEEYDLEIIKNHLLSEEDIKVNFFNFNKNIKVDKVRSECQKKLDLFIYFQNGKCKLFDGIYISEILNKLRRKNFIAYDISANLEYDEDDYPTKFKYLISKMYFDGFEIKNCFICSFQGINFDNYDSDPIFCKLFKFTCNSNKATSCNKFKVNFIYVNDLIKQGKYLMEFNRIN
jgi:hypothetical protein